MNAESSQAQQAPRDRMHWLKTIIAGVAGLFYAYGVWNAVAHLVTMSQLGLNGWGWFVMLFSILFPMLVFAAAYALSRRRGVMDVAVSMLAGLGLVAVFWMNVVAYTTLNFASLSA